MLTFIREVVRSCTPPITTYIEPFAGGAGVAIGLLKAGDVEAAVIGDADPAIAAFWRAALNSSDQLAERITECDVTIETWHEQHDILSQGPTGDDLALGFAAFFLNRTNYSGVLRARPIGGLKQEGPWPLDCRFNKQGLLRRLNAVAGLADRISVYEGDAVALLQGIDAHAQEPLFVYADPPYLTKATDLYMDTMTYASHQDLSRTLQGSNDCWMVSYDVDDRVKAELYPEVRILQFGLRHSAGQAHRGQELMAFSPSCPVDRATSLLRGAQWLNGSQTGSSV